MSDDRAAARAAHTTLCATHGVRDLYEGDCRGCGECCSRFVPVSVFDLRRLEPYVRKNGVRPREPRGELDLTCPWLTDSGECAVYPARPESCRVYRCDRHVRGELRGFFGASSAKVTDMRELAERWGDAGQGDQIHLQAPRGRRRRPGDARPHGVDDAHIKKEKASGTDNEPNLKENRC